MKDGYQDFRDWARQRYRDVTIERWVKYLKAIEEAGLNLDYASEEAIRSLFWDEDRRQALTAFQHYCEFRLDDFRRWCSNKYAKRSAIHIKGGLLTLLRAGIDLDSTSEEEIREMWYNKHHKQRTFVLRGFRKYQEFLEENGVNKQ